jgi:replicative DNA helicase
MGKCLAGAALVYDPSTGARRRIDDVVAAVERGEHVTVAGVGRDLQLHAAPVGAAMRSGVQPVFRLRTRLGRRIDATANHPLLTLAGWRELRTLRAGDRIGVPRRLPRSAPASSMPDDELVLLATRVAEADPTQEAVVPAAVFGLSDKQVARFVSVLYGRDGDVCRAAGERLAHDVQHLLLRLGIVAAIRPLGGPHEGPETTLHEVRITSREPLDALVPAAQVAATAAAVARAAEPAPAAAAQPSAASDLWWDEIASIERLGEQETYDLEVPELHSFVADDVVVHNSALMANFAENAALQGNQAVALFSLEMSEGELAQRFVASQASIKGDDLRKGKVAPSRWPKILEASNRLAESPLYIDDSSDLSVLDVRAKARRLAQQHADGLGLILIDYLQLMRSHSGVENRVEAIGQISRGLKTLARELEVPVIALSQLNRSVEQRTDKRPVLSDLRESGAIEQDADLVMFVYRDEYYDKDSEREGIAEVIISKHRNGGLGIVELTFQKDFPRFMSYVGDDRY